MPIPVWVLLGFAAWTLIILFTTVGVYRWSRILTATMTCAGKTRKGTRRLSIPWTTLLFMAPSFTRSPLPKRLVWGSSIITKSSSQSSPTRWPEYEAYHVNGEMRTARAPLSDVISRWAHAEAPDWASYAEELEAPAKIPPPIRLEIMATYSNEDFARIAVAICKDVADITPHKRSFEAAALWYRQDCRAPKSPTRVAPSAMSKKMKQIAKDARKLLRHLEVHDPREPTDGPGAIALLEFLASAEDDDEDEVIRATARIGRLVEIFDSIDAARALERRADKAAEDALRIGELIVPREYQGDVVVNNWIAAMMSIYKRLTGKEPRTSVGAPGTARRGKATGPMIRFLEAAGKPLGLQHSADSWRGRVRDLLTDGRKK